MHMFLKAMIPSAGVDSRPVKQAIRCSSRKVGTTHSYCYECPWERERERERVAGKVARYITSAGLDRTV